MRILGSRPDAEQLGGDGSGGAKLFDQPLIDRRVVGSHQSEWGSTTHFWAVGLNSLYQAMRVLLLVHRDVAGGGQGCKPGNVPGVDRQEGPPPEAGQPLPPD